MSNLEHKKKKSKNKNSSKTALNQKYDSTPFFKPKAKKNNDADREKSLVQTSLQSDSVQRKKNSDLPATLQKNMETSLGHDFSNVRIQKNSAEASGLNAMAFTKGDSVYFAPGEFNPGTEKGKNLIGHEFTHVVQQRSGVVNTTKVMGKGLNLNDNKVLEHEADKFGRKAVQGEYISKYRSSSLGIRNSLRSPLQAMSNVIQRDIKGSKELGYGKMELDFTKNDAAVKGGRASETGTIKFTPDQWAPKSNNIRLIQIVRTTDKSSGTEKDYTWTGSESDRNKVMTTRNVRKNIAGGFFVDHAAASANPRTKKSDAVVSPYYRDYWPNAGVSQDGHKKSRTDIRHASLWDGPGDSAPGRFLFVTSAKAADTGTYYGTALWGFEIYHDKGIAKIKGEYKQFREYRGQTFDAALEQFNRFYKNPGTPGAPTK